MAKIDLRSLKKSTICDSLKGAKVIVYGGNNLGKTYQMSRFTDKVLLLATEAGYGAADCVIQEVTSWVQFKDIVKQLTSEKVDKEDKDGRMEWETMQDMYDTIVIDTVENLVDLAEKQTCVEFGVRDLSEIEDSRKNGYLIYRKDFKATVDRLCHFGYTVIFISHEEFVEKTDAKGNKYRYMQPKGSENIKGSTRFVRDLCDFCIALVSNGVDEDGNPIPSSAYCKETKTIFARRRYAMIPFIKEFTAENLKKAMLDAMRKTAEDRKAGISPWTIKKEGYSATELINMIKPYFTAARAKFPDDVDNIVETSLGKRVSEATDDDVVQLENVYNQLTTLCDNQGIKVE